MTVKEIICVKRKTATPFIKQGWQICNTEELKLTWTNDQRANNNNIHPSGPNILECEIRQAIIEMRNGKSQGHDRV